MRKNCLLSIVALFFASSLCFFGMSSAKATEVSKQRVELLRSLVVDYFAENPLSRSNSSVARDVIKKFSEQNDFPLVPRAQLLTEEDYKEAAQQATEALVQRKYPPLDRGKLEQEAARKFPIYQKGDLVTLWYKPNPGRTMRVRGQYRGRTENAVQVGQHVILLQDVAMLPENEGELLKFDSRASLQRRREYVDQETAEYELKKKAYAARVRDLALEAEKRRAERENEKNGYIQINGEWQRLRGAVSIIIDEQRSEIEERKEMAMMQRKLLERERIIRSAIEVQQEFALAGSDMTFENPELLAEQHRELLAQQQLAVEQQEREKQQARIAAEAEAAAAVETTETEQVATVNDVEPEQQPETAEATEAAEFVPTLDFSTRKETSLIPWWFYLVLAVVGVIVVVALAVSFSHYRPQPGKFFKGKGKMQRDFWQMAEADPEHFMYVAYRFPTEQSARQSLLGLSYVSETTGGSLKCRKPIMFGFYPHHEKFVSFVGGDKLHYALWREASALFPELPEAEYFRVSPAPEVVLDIPDIQQLMADEDLRITFVEKREGTGDDYSLYYIYEAEDKDSAQAFLKKSNIETEGVHIICRTPEGTWGKDINGIYQE